MSEASEVKVGEVKVGDIVRTTEGAPCLGTIERIVRHRTSAVFEEPRFEIAVLVRWEDNPTGGLTECAPGILSSDVNVVDGLVLIERRRRECA